jgi:hypothetical protein
MVTYGCEEDTGKHWRAKGVNERKDMMEECTDIRIDTHFVIHVLDNRLPGVQCSQALTPFPEDLCTTLKTYLLSLLGPRFRRKHYGRFRPESVVLREYQGLLANVAQHGHVEAGAFLAVSQRLAALLFETMYHARTNGERPRPGDITPGDLLVGLFYSHEPQDTAVPYLFLIKVDLESALQRQMQSGPGGSMQTVLVRQDGLIPKLSAQHIHKSALIQYTNDPTRYDVIMTDPQAGKQGMAKFFADAFLGTEPFRTPDEQVETLFRRANTWVVEHEETLSPQERGDVLQSVRLLLEEHSAKAQPLTPRQLIEALPLTEPREAAMVRELRQSFEDTLTAPGQAWDSIPADRTLLIQSVPQVVAKSRVTYQLDFGVQLSGDQEALERLLVTPPHRVNGSTEFTIHTRTFRPVL